MTHPHDVPAPSPTVLDAMREAVAQWYEGRGFSPIGARVSADALFEPTCPIASALAALTKENADLREQAGRTVSIRQMQDASARIAALERENATLRAERDEAIARAREPIGDTWDQIRHLEGECRTFIRESNEWKAVADRAETELVTLRASAERMEAEHAEEVARLRTALEPFAKISFSFDGFSLDPAEMVVLGRCCGRFNPKEHAHLQKAVDTARASLTPKETPDA